MTIFSLIYKNLKGKYMKTYRQNAGWGWFEYF